MGLLDLPIELFRQILERTVITSGLARSIRLRLINSLFIEQNKKHRLNC
jgi:hypothetical protein